jgi:hypothetical protein
MPVVFPDGPFLIAAVMCEKVLTDKDGAISMIRAVDKITATATGPVVPEQMPPTQVNLSLVIMLKAGEARGRFMVKIRPEAPGGVRLAETELPVSFPGAPDAGANLIVNFGLVAAHEGLYWIDILLDDQLLTRSPLRIEYQPLRTGPQGLPPG